MIKYNVDSIAYSLNPTITLVSVNRGSSSNEFNLVYEDKNGTLDIIITKGTKFIKVNDNIVLGIKNDNVFESYNNVLFLNVYYN